MQFGHEYVVLIQGGSSVSSCVQRFGHLHWRVHISQNDSLVPAVSETPLEAVPSTFKEQGDLSVGAVPSLSHPFPEGMVLQAKLQEASSSWALFALLRCLALSLPWGQCGDKPTLWDREGSITLYPFPQPRSYGNT